MMDDFYEDTTEHLNSFSKEDFDIPAIGNGDKTPRCAVLTFGDYCTADEELWRLTSF